MSRIWQLLLLGLHAALGLAGCGGFQNEGAPYVYQCETVPEAAFTYAGGQVVCGENDPNLPPEPTLPTDVCRTLVANKSFPDENDLDTARVQAALDECKGRAVKLIANGEKNAFVTSHIEVDSVVLWVDEGVWLYASRNADLYQETGNCGKIGLTDSTACLDFIQVRGLRPGIVGRGHIDGQGGEPILGQDYSWWQLSGALRNINGSIGNPQLINLERGVQGFVLYGVHLHDAAKFHVKITATPPEGNNCDQPGDGYTIWGVTILTPRKLYNSQGILMTPHFARNTDGIDPGTTNVATCGVIACNTVSTADDQIAIKGGHLVKDLIIAHNHFGTGHGLSIGSETYGQIISDGEVERGIQNILAYDVTIDADSRSVGYDATDADFNGIRIKSDISRGGLVDNIVYRDICMRDQNNPLLISTAYNPLFAGQLYPEFMRVELHDVRHVTCMNTKPLVVNIEGHSAVRRAGPITLDNVVIDNIGPLNVYAEYADINLGPGGANFRPAGVDVNLTDESTGESSPKQCVFPKLPAPELPESWLQE